MWSIYDKALIPKYSWDVQYKFTVDNDNLFVIGIQGSRRDKFLKYLRRVFKNHFIIVPDLEYDPEYNPLRYRHYRDRIRYPHDKFVKNVAKTHIILFVFKLDALLGALLKIRDGKITDTSVKEYFKNEWHAHIYQKGNNIMGDLYLSIKKINEYTDVAVSEGQTIQDVTDEELLKLVRLL